MRENVLVHPWIICLVLQNCKITRIDLNLKKFCALLFFFNKLKNSVKTSFTPMGWKNFVKTFLTLKQLWVLLYLHLIWSNKQSNFRPSCNYLSKYLGFCYIWRANPLLWLRLPHQDLILHLRLIVLLAVLWIHILLLSPEIQGFT